MLEVKGLSVSYGQHRALHGASARVDSGEIVVIPGANGAGKSTLLKAVSGICEGQVSGEVRMDGIDISGAPANRIVEAGIALVPEGRGVFPELSVQENLALGAYPTRAREEEEGNLERVHALFPKLAERRRQLVSTMSGGEQQMVAIALAMMSHPRLLALDEPSLGLSPLLCKDLFHGLGAVRRAGIGILLVEQNAKQSLAIADWGYLLENGEIVHEAPAEALENDPMVQKAYLGAAGAAAPHHGPGGMPVATRPAPARPMPSATAPARPRGPSPSEIAAQAIAGVATRSRPAPPAAPPQPASAPAPAQSQPVAATAAAPPPKPQPRPAPPPS